jgi:hypothetical protein
LLPTNSGAWPATHSHSPTITSANSTACPHFRPIAVVASAGTVNTGAIDPLPEIAAICRRHDLWLHVDGAYGALAAIAVPEKFPGLELADSLSLDPTSGFISRSTAAAICSTWNICGKLPALLVTP